MLQNARPEAVASRICTDSRQLREGDFFIALSGENFDGHDFLGEVFSKGACAALIESDKAAKAPANSPVVIARRVRTALGQIAAAYRKDFPLNAIAVCGSNGKTSTKELLAAVLAEKLPTVKSEASFNNDIGVPLTLLSIESSHAVAVLEAGTNHPGELRPLLDMIRPRFGVITSIGREHLEHFGDLDGVLKEEGSLARVLPEDGKLFLSGDAQESARLKEWTLAAVTEVGRGRGNHWRITNSRIDGSGTTFAVEAPVREFSGEYRTNLFGEHQALNATYAIAVGAELGLSKEQIAAGLGKCRAAKMRLEAKRIDDFTVLDDAYNANADSMAAALRTLQEFPCLGRRIAVLGDMAELGQAAASAHAEVGRRVAEAGINYLIAVGNLSNTVAEAAQRAGLRQAFPMREVRDASARLGEIVRSGDVVLVKASRSSRLERVVKSLEEKFNKVPNETADRKG